MDTAQKLQQRVDQLEALLHEGAAAVEQGVGLVFDAGGKTVYVQRVATG